MTPNPGKLDVHQGRRYSRGAFADAAAAGFSKTWAPHVPRWETGIASIFIAGLLVLTGCRPHDFPQYPPNYREYAYVTNGGSNTVSIYDVVNVRLDRELPVGINPVAAVASPTRNEVYVVNQGASSGQGSVSVINAENNSVAANIPVGVRPVALALNPDGALAYVANSGANNISVLDIKSRRIIANIGAGEQPVALRVSPDNKTLVVANRAGNSVSIIDPETGMLRAVFSGCPGASDVVVLPDSSKAFAACSNGHQVMAIALARPAAHPAQPDHLESLLDVGHNPVQLALKPDGGEIFVLNSLSDSISELITGTNDVLGAYLMGADPVRGLVTADNSLLYVANLHSQEVTVYSIDDGKRVAGIHVGDGPSALAFSAAGNLIFVVDSRSGDVAVVRTDARSLFTLKGSLFAFTFLPSGRGPNAIADKAFNVR
jgi:YVTN family beta-propeller protein